MIINGFDLSKLFYLEECESGYELRMNRVDGQNIAITWIDKKKVHLSVNEFNANVILQHIHNDVIEVIEYVSGLDLSEAYFYEN